jgi:hypothetical protein
MTDFRATHVVPPEGLVVYATPDPSQATGAALDPGLAVAVAEVQGPWTRIVCSNGFTGWVDGRRLGPVAGPVGPGAGPVAGGRDRTTTWALVLIAVILLATAAGVASTLGGDDEGGSGPLPGSIVAAQVR